jgi:hypothetical protein
MHCMAASLQSKSEIHNVKDQNKNNWNHPCVSTYADLKSQIKKSKAIPVTGLRGL